MRSNDDDNLILFPSSKNFEVRLDNKFISNDEKVNLHADFEVDETLMREIEDSIEALDVKNIDRLTSEITSNNILDDDFEVEMDSDRSHTPQALFIGDFPQLDFEIDLMDSEDLIELIGKQQATLAEHQARISFLLNDINDTIN